MKTENYLEMEMEMEFERGGGEMEREPKKSKRYLGHQPSQQFSIAPCRPPERYRGRGREEN